MTRNQIIERFRNKCMQAFTHADELQSMLQEVAPNDVIYVQEIRDRISAQIEQIDERAKPKNK